MNELFLNEMSFTKEVVVWSERRVKVIELIPFIRQLENRDNPLSALVLLKV